MHNNNREVFGVLGLTWRLRMHELIASAMACDLSVWRYSSSTKNTCPWLDIVRWTSYLGHCTVDIVRWTLYGGHCLVDIVLYVGHHTLYIARWTSYVGHCTVDMVRWTSHHGPILTQHDMDRSWHGSIMTRSDMERTILAWHTKL